MHINMLSCSISGPPIEIISDYRDGVNNGAKCRDAEEDEAFSMVIEDAGIGASPIPEGGTYNIITVYV